MLSSQFHSRPPLKILPTIEILPLSLGLLEIMEMLEFRKDWLTKAKREEVYLSTNIIKVKLFISIIFQWNYIFFKTSELLRIIILIE